MDIRKDFGTNRSKERDGVEIPLGDDGASITLARAGGANYGFVNALTAHLRKMSKAPVSRVISEKSVSESEADLAAIYASHVVRGWKGIFEGDVEVVYTPENVSRMLASYPEFFRTVRDLAENVNNFRVDVEDESKN